MTRAKRRLERFLPALIALLCAGTAEAREEQGHLRLGFFNCSYTGPLEGSFSVPNTLELDYELFQSSRKSYFLRVDLGYDSGSSVMRQLYMGGGVRFYPFTKGSSFEATNQDYAIKSVPRSRMYLGVDAGIDQVVLRTPTPVQSIISQTIEAGGHVGYIIGVSDRVGIEGLAGASYGFGFSSVGVTTINIRLLAGVSYLF